MIEALTAAELAELPLFPLPHLVFFPGALLPLHLFEPRYRAMISWCIERRWPLAVTRIRAGFEDQQLGEPPIEGICGVGRLSYHSRTRDGRYHVLLQGVARVQILEELPMELPFRRARAALLPDLADVELDPERLSTLHAMVGALQQRFPGASSALSELSGRGIELVDGLGGMLFSDADARQRLLECRDPRRRLDEVEARVTELLFDQPAPAEG